MNYKYEYHIELVNYILSLIANHDMENLKCKHTLRWQVSEFMFQREPYNQELKFELL